MSEPCEIYVRFPQDGGKKLIARYFGWCYGTRLVSRAKSIIEWANDCAKEVGSSVAEYLDDDGHVSRLLRVIDVNFDMLDVSISSDLIQEWLDSIDGDEALAESFSDYIFNQQPDYNGQLFIDFTEDGKTRYAFVRNGDDRTIMDGAAYMDWNVKDWRERDVADECDSWKETCERNIAYIAEHAELMTDDELTAFIAFPYVMPDGDVTQFGLLPNPSGTGFHAIYWYDTDAERAKDVSVLEKLNIPYQKWLSVLPYRLDRRTYGTEEIPNRRFKER